MPTTIVPKIVTKTIYMVQQPGMNDLSVVKKTNSTIYANIGDIVYATVVLPGEKLPWGDTAPTEVILECSKTPNEDNMIRISYSHECLAPVTTYNILLTKVLKIIAVIKNC